MVANRSQGDKKADKRSVVAVLRDKFWLVVVALVIVASGIITLALAAGWYLQRTIS